MQSIKGNVKNLISVNICGGCYYLKKQIQRVGGSGELTQHLLMPRTFAWVCQNPTCSQRIDMNKVSTWVLVDSKKHAQLLKYQANDPIHIEKVGKILKQKYNRARSKQALTKLIK